LRANEANSKLSQFMRNLTRAAIFLSRAGLAP
jgi:hypothetical protein